ncbi:MAG: clathrin adaptor complex small chain-domain-containing protein [Olpidium bornovanus]|uniref:Coatomer subunit zeta n=1 Tax=Olpidium bornovanus TaxID=278681 RepID=A0A8H8DJM0_9FUNG|nr:MAG: clathrin adaptor complex small chain-domain-containing protein [Olpidium bornovanus]
MANGLLACGAFLCWCRAARSGRTRARRPAAALVQHRPAVLGVARTARNVARHARPYSDPRIPATLSACFWEECGPAVERTRQSSGFSELGLSNPTACLQAIVILDADGNRILAKYYGTEYPNFKDQRAFEKSLHEKTKRAATPTRLSFLPFSSTSAAGEIILYDGYVIVYKNSVDAYFYLVGNPDENEILLSTILNSFHDAVAGLLKQNVAKATIQENMDLVVLALDECIDDGIVLEIDPQQIMARISKRSEEIPITEQSLLQAYQTAKERFAGSLLK